jgi:hypothetical protein
MKICSALVAAIILVIIGCVPTTDTTNPTVSIVEPANNDTLSAGNISIKAVATDNKGVTKVEFYVDDTLKNTANSGTADTFSCILDASNYTAGSSHVIKAKAFDEADNNATASVTIFIAGGGGPTYHSGTISASETWWPSGNPHIIQDDVSVENNATLTIKPGCIVKFEPGVELYTGYGGEAGAIVAEGTQDSMITFTSYATTPSPGDWKNIGIYPDAMSTTSFKYCVIEYGGSNQYSGSFYVEGVGVKISNCTIRKSAYDGILLNYQGYFKTFDNNTVTECGRYPVSIYADYVRTIGTGNSFTGNIKDAIFVQGGDVTTTGTWANLGVPYVIEDDISIGDNSNTPTLTIAPGSTLKFQSGVEFYVGYDASGGLVADGTSGWITFTSAINPPAKGDWQGVGFYDLSIDSKCTLKNCKIEYAGSSTSGNVLIEDAVPQITTDSIGHGKGYGIYRWGTEYPDSTTLENNNTFYDNDLGDVNGP